MSYTFRAEWPIEDDGLDYTLAQLAQRAAEDVPDLLVKAGALDIGPWSWHIDVPEDPNVAPSLVAECEAEPWVDPVRYARRRKPWAVAP